MISLFFQIDPGGLIDSMPIKPEIYSLIRWVVTGLLATLVFSGWLIKYLWSQMVKQYDTRLTEKDDQITELKKTNASMFSEIKTANEEANLALKNIIDLKLGE